MSTIRLQGFDHNSVQSALNQLSRMVLGSVQAQPRQSPPAPSSLIRQVSQLRDSLESGGVAGLHSHDITDIYGLRDLLNIIEEAVAQLPEITDRIENLEARIPEPFTYTQAMPGDVWTVVHNLGFIPNIEVVDSGGTPIVPAIDHNHPVAPTTTVLTFFFPTSGMARLS